MMAGQLLEKNGKMDLEDGLQKLLEKGKRLRKVWEELEQGFLNEKQKLENEERMKQVQSLSQMEGYRR